MSSPTIVITFLFYFSYLSKCEVMSQHGSVYGAYRMRSLSLACGEQRVERSHHPCHQRIHSSEWRETDRHILHSHIDYCVSDNQWVKHQERH